MRTTVRRVRPEDAARVRAIRLEMLADTPLAFLERLDHAAARSHDEFAARIANNASAPDSAQFIAESGGRVVGHAGGWAAPGGAPGMTTVFAVYVTPGLRGTGVVDQLVEAVADWSRTEGRPLLGLEVLVGNERAIRAYQRLGFLDTGTRIRHPTLPFLTEQLMVRPA
jgi:ribosomal protein S18 acetylase RimI-like enzyme